MPTHSFHALVLNLVALNDGVLAGALGELAHAAFYAAIRSVDPALAQQMHDAQGRSAFSLSPLFGYWRSPADKTIHVREGQPGWLRVCLLDTHLRSVFLEHLQHHALPTIRLGDVHLGVMEALGTPGSHPWSGYTTLDDLRNLDRTPERWLLDFASPTAIRWGEAENRVRQIKLFPEPRVAIAGLRSRWDRLTGETWGIAFEEWVEKNSVVSRIDHWKTESVPYRGQVYHGGVGRLEYRVLDASRTANVAHLNRLLEWAFYTGIGYKTTHGFGMVRLHTDDRS